MSLDRTQLNPAGALRALLISSVRAQEATWPN